MPFPEERILVTPPVLGYLDLASNTPLDMAANVALPTKYRRRAPTVFSTPGGRRVTLNAAILADGPLVAPVG